MEPYISEPFAVDDAAALVRHASPWWTNHWAKLYSARYRAVRVDDELCCDDAGFNLHCVMLGGTMVYLSSPGVAFRQHAVSLSARPEKQVLYFIDWVSRLPGACAACPAPQRDKLLAILDWVLGQRRKELLHLFRRGSGYPKAELRALRRAFRSYARVGGLRMRHLPYGLGLRYRLAFLWGFRRFLKRIPDRPNLTSLLLERVVQFSVKIPLAFDD